MLKPLQASILIIGVAIAPTASADDGTRAEENQIVANLGLEYQRCAASEANFMAKAHASVEAITRAAIYRCRREKNEHEMAVIAKNMGRGYRLSAAESELSKFNDLLLGMVASQVIEVRMQEKGDN